MHMSQKQIDRVLNYDHCIDEELRAKKIDKMRYAPKTERVL